MVYFPEREPDGRWVARQVFTKRIPHTADFAIDGDELRAADRVTALAADSSPVVENECAGAPRCNSTAESTDIAVVGDLVPGRWDRAMEMT
jgi:hypothetical protein